jgi:ATP-binding cassette subfamily F protein uup
VPGAAPPARRKLGFREKHALETLPQEIDALQARIRALHAKLDDPAFYTRDSKGFGEATAALAAAQEQLLAAEEKWLELELLREEIAGG